MKRRTGVFAGRSSPPASDPVTDSYKKDIDRTLLQENLKRTVTERIERLVALQRLADEARKADRRRGQGAR